LTGTNEDWLVRADSVNSWNDIKIPQDGWSFARMTADDSNIFNGHADIVWGDTTWRQMYIWNNVFLSGVPRDGSVYIRNSGKYKLYINASLILSDTIGSSGDWHTDSATGITSLLKGGDNIIAAEVSATADSVGGVAIMFSALIDTTQKFQTAVKMPESINRFKSIRKRKDRNSNDAHEGKQNTVVSNLVNSSKDTVQYRTRAEITKAIEMYRSNETLSQIEISKETEAIQQLKMKIDEINKQLKGRQK
jgi:hypothetical protein